MLFELHIKVCDEYGTIIVAILFQIAEQQDKGHDSIVFYLKCQGIRLKYR